MAAVGPVHRAEHSTGWSAALLVSTSMLIGIVLASSILAFRGPSDHTVTVPVSGALTLAISMLALLTARQLRSRRRRPSLRAGSLVVAQLCVAIVVVSIQHLGYVGLLTSLIGGAAGAAAICVSWTHARDGGGVVAGWVGVGAFVLVAWFAGRADERSLEGVVAAAGIACCAAILHRLRRRWRGAD